MKLTAPNRADLAQMLQAIQSFPRAWGSIDASGEFRPMAADPRIAWVMIRSTAEQHTALWRLAGISTATTSSFAEMQSAAEHIIHLHLFKFRKGWFRSVWAANVLLLFDDKQVMAGAIAARSQPALWDRFRSLVAGCGETMNSVQEAAAAV